MAVNKISPILGLLFATFAVACAPVRARPAPTPTPLTLEPPTTSCAVNPAERKAIEVRDVEWIGRAGDRTWFVAKNGPHRALFRLVAGELQPIELPKAFDDGFVSAHTREHFIWVLRTGPGETIAGPAWVLVDVKDPAKPRISRIESLDPLAADQPNRFALWSDRAYFYLGSPGELVLWNLDKAAMMGSRVRPETKNSETPWLHCSASACVAIMPEGSEAKRKMVLRRVDRNGAEQHEEIGPGIVAESMTMLTGNRIFSAWSRFDGKGLWARKIDAMTGNFDGESFTVSGVEQDLQDPQAIASRNGPLLAWQAARIGWRLGKLREDGLAVSDVITIPAEGSFLSAATTDDGIVASIFSAGQDEERGNEWYSSVHALFVPFGKAPKPADVITLVNDEHGKGRGGYGGYAIAAPDSAAVLVTPRGDTKGESFVKLLRKPCAP
jgi:hypothetical protein